MFIYFPPFEEKDNHIYRILFQTYLLHVAHRTQYNQYLITVLLIKIKFKIKYLQTNKRNFYTMILSRGNCIEHS